MKLPDYLLEAIAEYGSAALKLGKDESWKDSETFDTRFIDVITRRQALDKAIVRFKVTP